MALHPLWLSALGISTCSQLLFFSKVAYSSRIAFFLLFPVLVSYSKSDSCLREPQTVCVGFHSERCERFWYIFKVKKGGEVPNSPQFKDLIPTYILKKILFAVQVKQYTLSGLDHTLLQVLLRPALGIGCMWVNFRGGVYENLSRCSPTCISPAVDSTATILLQRKFLG